ncbi:MAG: dUTP diphosphatase [Dehalococcoidia bacterium]|jgi:dUTP pyrophosphatase|uniref:dUTP diphosphatase n=1 Tax=Candidatus Amarobacter glycogenicus TaxID=3140699 RepID=UPI001D27A64F|nr:dUTP diphosphatase [Dehalococcoidia bacterium]MBK6560366.1 dUTP diphosphatase [Dehalococcoidia bacterium]MBK7726166.1 dUTP diphosphatase [Dehalococcoidia bacterium]MBK8559544.1 dUTP diphosphatase [Dehalococcoidia bacterium]MBK9342610.1 dUTP diphosphatase [Dehalococcoidia bacterium]
MLETIRVQLLRPGARLPFRATEQASGYDIHACLEGGPVVIGQRPVVIPTGLAMEVPPGLDAQFRPRSGLARQGILSTFGTLDSDYRGEIMITLYSVAPDISHTVQHGDRIAQLVVTRLAEIAFEQALVLSETIRGAGGHGSTGR